jgi:hypothetical protein
VWSARSLESLKGPQPGAGLFESLLNKGRYNFALVFPGRDTVYARQTGCGLGAMGAGREAGDCAVVGKGCLVLMLMMLAIRGGRAPCRLGSRRYRTYRFRNICADKQIRIPSLLAYFGSATLAKLGSGRQGELPTLAATCTCPFAASLHHRSRQTASARHDRK